MENKNAQITPTINKDKKRLTPIQELIVSLEEKYDNATEQAKVFKRESCTHSMITSEAMALGYKFSIDEAKKLLEVEKFMIETSYHNGRLAVMQRINETGEEYYNGFYELNNDKK